ncbi:FecCD family ABC transporter permease [Agrobacterium sp. NPDC090273]|uniref:FecCD family ABC transporter permease n=1 Tax=Agrobacterium sp. NPDC090273 TaxID=3363919 RepID=UPI00383A0D3A
MSAGNLDRVSSLPLTRGAARAFSAGLGLLAIILIVVAAHAATGARPVAPHVFHDLIFAYDPKNFDQQILIRLRLPRIVACLLAGACFGVAGLILQTVLRNPLGEPHILGLNAGASLAVVALSASPFASIGVTSVQPLVAAGGAGAVFALVLALSAAGQRGLTPTKLVFCGIALSTLAGTLTSAILILNEETLQQTRFWLVGDAAGITLPAIVNALPVAVTALVLATALAPRLDLLALGENAATALGVPVRLTWCLALIATSLLCGVAISLVGPIGFIGLVVPPLTSRIRTGRLLFAIPLAALGGATLLIAADLAARLLIAPRELPTGAMTGLVGAPVFLWLARRLLK